MTEVVRGQVSDRPWGVTLAQFEHRKVSGQLTVRAADGRHYEIAFDHGDVVGARSPQPADAAPRIALMEGLVTSSQTALLAERIAATPDKDEAHTIAAVCRLDVTQTLRLRRRLLVQRAARTFSIEEGSFVVDDVLTIPVTNAVPVDLREVIYQGARTNLTEHRLATDLRGFGSHFALAAEASPNAERFGFDATARGVLDSLRDPKTIAEIEAQHPDLDPRWVQSMIYALVSCRACVPTNPRSGARTTTQPVQARTLTRPATARTSTMQPRTTTTPPLPWRAPPAPIALPGDDDDYKPPLRTASSSGTTGTDAAARMPTVPTSNTPTVSTTKPPPDTRTPTPPRTTTPMPMPTPQKEDPAVTAASAYREGQVALSSDDLELTIERFTKATLLNPRDFGYSAALAWAQFLLATDDERAKSAGKVRNLLNHAIQKSVESASLRLYLGRLERTLGHAKQALEQFSSINEGEPGYAEAQLAIEEIEQVVTLPKALGLAVLFRKKP